MGLRRADDIPLPLRHLDAFQFCRAEDSAKMEALEEVDGVSETIMAQGQVIPSDTIAAGKLTMALYQPLRMRSVVMSSNTSARHPACVQPLSTCSCNLKAGHEVYAVWQGTWQADLTFLSLGCADAASESLHVRTGPLLGWVLDYSGTLSVLVQTESAW